MLGIVDPMGEQDGRKVHARIMAPMKRPEAIFRQVLDPFRARAIVEFCVGCGFLWSVVVAHIGETFQLGFTIAVDDDYLADDGRWAQVGSSSVGALSGYLPGIICPINQLSLTVFGPREMHTVE